MTPALLPWLALLPLGAAGLLALLPADARRGAALLAGAAALGVAALALGHAPALFKGQVPAWSISWLPALGLSFGFRMDGLAWLFTLLVGGIGAGVVLYAAWYLDPRDPPRRFFMGLLVFMGAMLGVVLADNLILLVVYWELTSLASFLLIGYWHRRDDARAGARMALTVTGAGGLALLAGVLLIGHIVGDHRLDVVLRSGDLIRAHPLYEVALVLVLLGAFTKSAQFPFHFWLPHAMAAPTPVSAYLHSATMVKAGVFLLARLYPALGGSEPWFWIVSSVGLATLVLGACAALFQHDLKGLLAYSTISHLGLITLLLGLDEPLAVVAGVFHVINHALFKAGLFMSAGIIDHETGTRDMRVLRGLARAMPFTAALGTVAAAAMAGVPLLNGFLSKEMFFAETLAKDTHAAMQLLLPAAATLAGVFSVAYSLRFVHDVFFHGPPEGMPRTPHEAPFFMRLPVLLLVALCLLVGLLPGPLVGPLLALAAQAAVHGAPGPALPPFELAIWHGVNLPLAMSAAAALGGVALYAALHRKVGLHRLHGWPWPGLRTGRERFMATQQWVMAAARRASAALHTGRLQRHLTWLVGAALVAGAWPFVREGAGPGSWTPLHLHGLTPAAALVGAIGMAGVLGCVLLHRRRLTALLLLGLVGLVVCLAFVRHAAPDLALTQLLVEMATTLLMMLVLAWLPDQGMPEPAPGPRRRAALVAVLAGAAAAALAWHMMALPAHDPVSAYFLEQARPQGGGANVVNVVIVDFRAFDTLGEITVMAVAALVVQALLARQLPHPSPVLRAAAGWQPLMLQRSALRLLPFVWLVALYLLLRGHNLPGGGFIAGLVLALGLMLQAMALGLDRFEREVRLPFARWAGWGLLVAAGTGAASWGFGAPFLTSTYDYPWLPGVGGVPLTSAALFDLGVLLVVTGATLVMLLSMARLGRTEAA